jgi:hypothetical protein
MLTEGDSGEAESEKLDFETPARAKGENIKRRGALRRVKKSMERIEDKFEETLKNMKQ